MPWNHFKALLNFKIFPGEAPGPPVVSVTPTALTFSGLRPWHKIARPNGKILDTPLIYPQIRGNDIKLLAFNIVNYDDDGPTNSLPSHGCYKIFKSYLPESHRHFESKPGTQILEIGTKYPKRESLTPYHESIIMIIRLVGVTRNVRSFYPRIFKYSKERICYSDWCKWHRKVCYITKSFHSL